MSADEQAVIAGDRRYGTGIDDVIIVPVAAIALIVRKLLRAILRALVRIIDWLFPILLQIMRFPLFTARILGDALAALTRAVVGILPVGGDRRAAWREWVSQHWAWLRGKISYKAFEEWLHHVFEDGMAWVFRTCRSLSPRNAVLVLIGAVLWLPISFGVATAMHTILFAKALTWPAWTQLLHPFATVIAKSKLLVLPVYPAAWPQARQHPLMQGLIRFWCYLGTLYVVRKIGYRYRQLDGMAAAGAAVLSRTSAATGLTRLGQALLNGFNAGAAAVGGALRFGAGRIVAGLSMAPLIGGVVQRYAKQYDDVNSVPALPLSERSRNFFDRWSVKFTARYYEDKERAEAAKVASGQSLATP